MTPSRPRELERPRAFVFDLDGTLVDSRRDIAQACNFALRSSGREELPVDTIAGFVGDGARRLLARAFAVEASDPSLDAAFDAFQDYYAAHAADFTRWMPGVRETLSALSGLPLSIATNKPRRAAIALLEALGARELFVRVVCGGDGPLKPDPEVIRLALGPSGVPPSEAWVVGDGVQDVLAARAAGAVSVAVLGGFGSEAVLRAAEPRVVVANFSELLDLFEGGGVTS